MAQTFTLKSVVSKDLSNNWQLGRSGECENAETPARLDIYSIRSMGWWSDRCLESKSAH